MGYNIPEQCNTCQWWKCNDGEGVRQFDEGWFLGPAYEYGNPVYGMCIQTGQETKADQWCDLYEMHRGLDRMNGTGYY